MLPSLSSKQNAIKDFIQKSCFNRFLLAVSGGLDSICLAHYFITNKEALGIEWLGIAHVHHGLREGTADRDAEFVRNFAKEYDIPFFLKKLDGNTLKASEGSLEENARKARYEALTQFARENKANVIVTAHHAGDQAETMYLRLRRGVTLAGLHGMQQIRLLGDRTFAQVACDTPSDNLSFQIYRPFLNISREELCEYAKENHLAWCEDESNADTKFARNKIRHILLPALETKCQGATTQLCYIASLADKAYSKVIKTTDKLFSQAIIPEYDWPFEASLSPYKKVLALDNKILQKVFAKCSSTITNETQAQGLCELFRLWLDSRGFRFPILQQPSFAPLHTTFNSLLPTSYSHYRTRSIEKCRNIIWIFDTKDIQTPTNLYFSNEKSRFSEIPGQWRHPCEGDVLWPLDMKIKACKLATWLQEKSIPHWIRDSLQVFVQDSRVLFVSGMRTKNLKMKG